ncbi:TIGR01777 family oxidoreductase [Ammoniphilus sp. 3BR4]|uniref:TIGR01777 family oxidoreductase n=1 Tax=Ammoniphilus sp. 3BR4 TaxID=3158265 RepID=UPI0034660B22
MDIIIFGGSGFVGQHLAKYLENKGHQVWIASRKEQQVRFGKNVMYTPEQILSLFENMNNEYSVINLAGQSINSGRWTAERKREILQSRVNLTQYIVKAIIEVNRKPLSLINASAIGFYGYSDEVSFTEQDKKGKGFLADVTQQWEETANQAKDDTRVVLARLGVVLGRDGGALPRMILPYTFFVGGKVGTGNQWLSWVHIEDVCRILHFCIEQDTISGPVNVTSPAPERMDRFGQVLGHVMQKPHWIPVPSFMLRLLLGEMSEIVLQGHPVLPEKMLSNGYSYKHPTLSSALKDLLK